MAVDSIVFGHLDDGNIVEAEPNASHDFDALYRRFYPRLVALCRRRAGDDTLAEDVAQETLIRALTHSDAFDHRRPAWPWLKTIATNLIVDHYRKQVREASLPPEHAATAVDGPSIEEADLLKRAIEKLPRRQRAAVALRYLNDWDAHDAASFMGVTRPAYEQLLFRARRRLKTEYRRLSQELSAGAALGSASLRAWARRVTSKARELAASNPSLADITSITGAQLAGGALAFAIVFGAQPAPAVPGARSLPPTATREVAARAGDDSGPRRARGDGALSPGSSNEGSAPVAQPVTANDDGEHARNRSLLGDMTNEDVQSPEDAHVTSIVLGSGTGEADFAAGRAECVYNLCSAVLFKSLDGGATWERLPAEGFDSEIVLVPRGDDGRTIFGMGRAGLQVSRDGGATFTPAAATGATHAAGAAAISPAFNDGDPSILIGAQTLMRYRDDLGVVEPTPWAAGAASPLEPAFAPQYPTDGRVVVGGLAFNSEFGRVTSTVHTCVDTLCTSAHVGDRALPVHVRLAPDFAASNLEYAFTSKEVHSSNDGGRSFRALDTPWQGHVYDIAAATGGRVLAAVGGADRGLYSSTDGGTTWWRISHELFDGGASSIAIAGDRIVVALGATGLACSDDAGSTWKARCGSSA